MAKPTVEIVGKKIILLSGYQRCPQTGSERVKLGSIVIQEMRSSAIGDQEPGSCSVRIHCWKMDARGVINIPFSLSRAVFVMIRLLRADVGSRSCVPAFPQLSLPVPSKSSS